MLGSSPQPTPRLPEGADRAFLCSEQRSRLGGGSLRSPGSYASRRTSLWRRCRRSPNTSGGCRRAPRRRDVQSCSAASTRMCCSKQPAERPEERPDKPRAPPLGAPADVVHDTVYVVPFVPLVRIVQVDSILFFNT